MSPDLPQASPLFATVNVGDQDRRSHRRYPVELGVHYEVFRNRETVRNGSGKTVNLSTGGVLFSANQALPSGLDVALRIDWPTGSPAVPLLELQILGRVVWSSMTVNAVTVSSYEFRIRR
jgi:hypothetical protein